MMKKSGFRRLASRLAAGLLTLTLLAGLLPAGILPARAAEDDWMQTYLNKLVDWGVMRGDQYGNLNPNQDITRAEYISMINRAYGYDEPGKMPFNDVPLSAWYYDDISIAATAGYFTGVSDSAADPESNLSREQATVILGRNLMLEQGIGESLDFTDSRLLSDWSRGLVKTAAYSGVVKGYPDGSFRPQNNITRGEVASLLVNSIGTPLHQEGDYTLGSIYGNVTISSSGVTLRDTTIAGDLYISGGVGLGYVTLENVTVLGKIVASGAGESNKGDSSIILRNVISPEMVIDSPANQFVTLRAEGNTEINKTSVRTPTYLEDTTEGDLGLKYIELKGEEGTTLELAGNIKEVLNSTPRSSLRMARGTAQIVTVDEYALGSTVVIDAGAEIKTLNLDTATAVTGTGDIENLNVNAAGCTVAMLPDNIVIRPGLTANIGGFTMDTVAATESSLDPRLLSGYPQAVDIAPTTFTALFSTNKQGTVYWAVSSVADGSVTEDDLVSPPSYGAQILKSGNVRVAASNTETPVKVSGLTSDGSFYLAAVLVDARGQHSPVKVISLSTPDDSTPNFTTGYPYMSQVTNIDAQVAVMTTKSCKLYHALLPKGSAAPTAADFKASAVTGNLGFGVRDAAKNTPLYFQVNDVALEEVVTYDLYLWLSDADGAKSSAVKKVTFTTVDKTPPEFSNSLSIASVKANAVGFTAALNEAGTLYWAVVKADAEYPKPMNGQTGPVDLTTEEAKIQVASGMNAIKSGKTNMSENKDATFNVSGLEPETAYDLYYVAQDKAGNYGVSVLRLPFTTLDENAPTASLEFSDYNGSDTTTPLANSDVRLVFNEKVQTYPGGVLLDELYSNYIKETDAARKEELRTEMANTLAGLIDFRELTGGDNNPAIVRNDQNAGATDWAIDYRNAVIKVEDGKTVITFANHGADTTSAINLRSGSTYRFDISGLSDTSRNAIRKLEVPSVTGFTVAFAQVNLKPVSTSAMDGIATDNGAPITPHLGFTMQPMSTENVDNSIDWDMLIWSDTTIEYDLYRRVLNKSDNSVDEGWEKLGNGEPNQILLSDGDTFLGNSLTRHITQKGRPRIVYDKLNTLAEDKIYEYGIHITKMGDNATETTWNGTINMKVGVVAGMNLDLDNLTTNISPASWEEYVKTDGHPLTSIGNYVAQGTDELTMRKPFSDQSEPEFTGSRPSFTPTDSSVLMDLMLNREGTVFYAVAKEGDVLTQPNTVRWDTLPLDGTGTKYADGTEIATDHAEFPIEPPEVTLPTVNQIITKELSNGNPDIKTGSASVDRVSKKISVTGLEADTKYMVYFVLKGKSAIYSEVQTYGFKTEKVYRPVITLTLNNPSVNMKVDRQSDVDYLLVTLEDNFIHNTILGKPVVDWLDTDIMPVADFATRFPTVKTVLDALKTDVSDGIKSIGSVFDHYASQTAKDSVATFIRSSDSGVSDDIFLKNSTSISANGTATVNCAADAQLVVGSEYLFLAVAKSPLGSGDAFRGIHSVTIKDAEPPKVAGATFAVTKADVVNNTPMFWGNISVTFTKPLYEKHTKNSIPVQLPVYPRAMEPGSVPVSAGYVCLGSLLILPGSTVTFNEQAGSTSPALTITFKAAKMTPNSVITLSSVDLCDQYGTTQPRPLTLTLRTRNDEAGNPQPYIDVTPKAWDGRE